MSSLTAATSSGSRPSRKPTASAPKKATASQRTGRDSDEATCHTSVLMNRNVMNSSSIGRARVTSENSDPSSLEVRRSAQRAIGPTSRISAAATAPRMRGIGEQRAERPVAVPAQGQDDGGRPEHEDGQLDDADPPGPLHRLAVPGQVGQRPDGEQQQEPDPGVEQPGRPGLVRRGPRGAGSRSRPPRAPRASDRGRGRSRRWSRPSTKNGSPRRTNQVSVSRTACSRRSGVT